LRYLGHGVGWGRYVRRPDKRLHPTIAPVTPCVDAQAAPDALEAEADVRQSEKEGGLHSRFSFLIGMLVLATASVVGAAEYVHNRATPRHPKATVSLKELWRIDAESEECVIGSIAGIVSDADGRSYFLDTQMGEVVAVGRNGKVEARIGRIGDGPGEFRRPVDLFLDEQGMIGVVQALPAKVVLLAPDGTPQETAAIPKLWDRGMDIVREVKYSAGRMLVRTALRDRSHPSYTLVSDAIVGVDQATEAVVWYRERHLQRAADNNHHREYERTYSVSPWTWAVGSQGKVFVNEAFDRYEIFVYSLDGKLLSVIDREYESRERGGAYRRNLQKAFDDAYVGRTYRGIPVSFEVSANSMDIQELFVRENGELWVLSSCGAYDSAVGEVATVDVFDEKGEFVRQVTFLGEGCYFTDELFISRDMFYVVRNVTVDWREDDVRQSVGTDSFELICYQIPGGN